MGKIFHADTSTSAAAAAAAALAKASLVEDIEMWRRR
jgi:hypothetical protein